MLLAVALALNGILLGCSSPAGTPPATAPGVPLSAAPDQPPATATTGAASAPPAPVAPAASGDATPTLTPLAPLADLRVVLDPGHNAGNGAAAATIARPVADGRGGTKACNTTGTATRDGYPEHAFTYDVADRTRALLEAEGATVILTRGPTGVGPCVDVRGRSPQVNDADVMVSIHANGSESSAPHGFFAIVVATPLNDAQGAPSRALAADLVAALEASGFSPSAGGALQRRDDLGTLNHATRPAVLLELAEFRNPAEARAVQDPAVRQRYAEAVAAGITAWAR